MRPTTRPAGICPRCDHNLVCTHCDDLRPMADEIWAGCQIRTPFDRYETVTRTAQEGHSRIAVYTEQSPRPWYYNPYERVDMIRPMQAGRNDSEIRVVDPKWNGAPIYAYATSAKAADPAYRSVGKLVSATPLGRGEGWLVCYHRDDKYEAIQERFAAKGKARARLMVIARGFAARYGVAFRVVD